MNYRELIDTFKFILNRTDCSDEDAERYINMGARRVSRTLRTPMQEVRRTYNVGADWPEELIVPANFLSLIGIYLNGRPLSRVPRSVLVKEPSGPVSSYSFSGGIVEFNRKPASGDQLELHYHRDFEEGHMLGVMSDVFVYAALVYAADAFTDNRLQQWEAYFQTLKAEILEMTDEEARSGQTFAVQPVGGGLV